MKAIRACERFIAELLHQVLLCAFLKPRRALPDPDPVSFAPRHCRLSLMETDLPLAKECLLMKLNARAISVPSNSATAARKRMAQDDRQPLNP